ncbi:hypothetical protein [Xanthocytophaga agilis]|uniref:Fibronectin type-III domain-containing protein n=1 Tax=Xanthocytophaga agilis TaxID=3048010 RepID=A0AAE3R462_9BACT|nr:hypothetical protein [Xanthocytophaga agilis]MDJ1501252.1 hypothetical protein [Xanthocytophaga agilis]
MKKTYNAITYLLNFHTTYILPAFLISCVCMVMGCDEIFEQDITNKKVVLMAPADSAASVKVTQTFRWQTLEGARQYRLEIGSPSLLEASDYFIDTTTSATSLRLVLQPGRFEWRLTALNAGYTSQSAERYLRIDTSSDLGQQSFRLLYPANNSTQGSNAITFQWEALPMADRYVFELDGETIDTLSSNRFIKTFATDSRSYSWQVTALNAKSSKAADQAFTFSIDMSNPTAPTLVSPLSNATLQNLPVTLSWQRGATAVVRDSVYLYTNAQTLITGYPKAVTTTSYQITSSTTNLGAGTYYWAVKSVSTSGKASSLSEMRSFTLLF